MTGIRYTPVDYGGGPTAFAHRNASVPTATVYTWLGYFRVDTLPPGNCPVMAGKWFDFGDQHEGVRLSSAGNITARGYNGSGGSAAITLGTVYAISVRRNGDDFDVRYKDDGGSWSTLYSVNASQSGRPAWGSLGWNEGTIAWEGGSWLSRFYTDDLSDGEIDTELESLTPVRTSDLWADWQKATGALYDDSSGNSRTLNNSSETSDWGTSDLPLVYAPDGAIAGAAAGVATTTGTLRGRGFVSGTVAGAAATTAVLRGRGMLAGAAAGVASTAAALYGRGRIAGASAGVATASAAIRWRAQISGAIAGVASTVASLLGRGYVAGVAAGAAVVSGTLHAFGRISGTAAGTATATGTLNGEAPDVSISGSAAGSATVTATLRGIGRMSGASHGTSTAVLDNLDVFEFPARYQLRAGLVDTRPRISR